MSYIEKTYKKMDERMILLKLKNMCKDIEEATKMAEHSTLHFGPELELAKKENISVMNYYEKPEKSYLDDYTILGTCSLCGGPVGIPKIYFSTIPPTPTCLICKAFKKENYGPVIDMVEPIKCDTKGF